jgi:hypothetical protein
MEHGLICEQQSKTINTNGSVGLSSSTGISLDEGNLAKNHVEAFWLRSGLMVLPALQRHKGARSPLSKIRWL